MIMHHRANVSTFHLQQVWYDFNYDDEDTVMNELDELYSYVEMPQVAENLRAWQGSFKDGMGESFDDGDGQKD